MKNEIEKQLLTILNPNQFFGTDDWERVHEIKLEGIELPMPPQRLAKVMEGRCPFVRGKKIKETHFLMFMPSHRNKTRGPITIEALEKLYPHDQQPKFYCYTTRNSWYKDQPFAKQETGGNDWILFFKGIIPHSRHETYDEHLMMLPAGYKIPNAIVAATAHFLIYEKNDGEKVTRLVSGRTASIRFGGPRISVGAFDNNGLCINCNCDDDRNGDLGVFAYRKL